MSAIQSIPFPDQMHYYGLVLNMISECLVHPAHRILRISNTNAADSSFLCTYRELIPGLVKQLGNPKTQDPPKQISELTKK